MATAAAQPAPPGTPPRPRFPKHSNHQARSQRHDYRNGCDVFGSAARGRNADPWHTWSASNGTPPREHAATPAHSPAGWRDSGRCCTRRSPAPKAPARPTRGCRRKEGPLCWYLGPFRKRVLTSPRRASRARMTSVASRRGARLISLEHGTPTCLRRRNSPQTTDVWIAPLTGIATIPPSLPPGNCSSRVRPSPE
jgi:hypothetical protein